MRTNVTRQFRRRERNVHYVVVSLPARPGNESAWERNVPVPLSLPYGIRRLCYLKYNNNNNDRLTAFDPGQPG